MENSNEELSWDHSPEQYQLEDQTKRRLDAILTPTPLFSDSSEDNLSATSSHDDVFMQNTPTRRKNNKLTRRNAIRLKNMQSEPRITRRSLRNQQGFLSQPSSPTAVDLHQRQNLDLYLRPRYPLAHDLVDLNHVQNLQHVLPVESTIPRRSERTRPRVDYATLHTGERRRNVRGRGEMR